MAVNSIAIAKKYIHQFCFFTFLVSFIEPGSRIYLSIKNTPKKKYTNPKTVNQKEVLG